MATIDTGTQYRAVPQTEPRPVVPTTESKLEPKQAVAQIQEIAAKNVSSRNDAVTEMDKTQARLEDAISMLNERPLSVRGCERAQECVSHTGTYLEVNVPKDK